MSDYTKTKNYDLYLPVPNADNDVWGDHLNSNTTTLDGLIKSVSDKSGVVTFNTRAGAVTLTNADVVTVLPPGSSSPTMDGTASAGTATAWSRQDHVHPTDTSRAPLNSPIFTGVPVMPTGTQAVTQTAGTSNQTLATTAFVTTSLGAVPGGAVIAPTAPALNPGGLWWDSTGGQLYVRYDDGTSVAYVAATNVEGLANAATKAEVGAALGNVGRNLVHNGLFNVWQRGFGAFSTLSFFTADRWLIGGASDTVSVYANTILDADRVAIGDETPRYSMVNAFTGNAAAAAYNALQQTIEDVRRLSGKTVILSFWAKANAGSPKLGINAFQRFGTGGSPSAIAPALAVGNSVTLSTAWARYSSSFALPSIAGKTLGTNGDDGTALNIFFSSGATSNAQAGNIGVQSGTVSLWGVQLEIAAAGQTQPSPLDKPDNQVDRQNCSRFYQVLQLVQNGYGVVSTNVGASTTLISPMRGGGTIGVLANTSSGIGTITPGFLNYGGVYVTANTTATGQYFINVTLTISADL